MSEEFSYDFIIEEEQQGANRTFLIIAGSLVALFILIILCVAGYAFLNRADNSSQIAAIETENAETAAQNAQVTQTIVAMEMTAQAPTPTFTASPTSPPTETPTNTPAPTDTAVVQTPGAGDGTAEVEATGISLDGGTTTVTPNPEETPNIAGTQIFGGDGGTFATGTPITGTGAGGTGSGSGTGTLPQTGITTAGLVAIGLFLVLGVFVARRLRTG
jgi:LPXTG-motif cell wall-anchored protein